MASEQREEFERRLLALVRRQLDHMDEDYPQGWEVTEFVVTARYSTAPGPDETLEPWHGGAYPGWGLNQFVVGSSPVYWLDAQLLEEALQHAQRRQGEIDSGEPEKADDSDDVENE